MKDFRHLLRPPHSGRMMALLVSVLCSLAAVGENVVAQQSEYNDFNSTADLTTYFNPSSSPVFTNIADSGIGNTGSINVPIGSQDVWTTKTGYSVSGTGDVYTVSAFFKIKQNAGYGGVGFTTQAQNDVDMYGSPATGLGMCFHGGGGFFVSDRIQTSVSWPPDLVLGNWYKMILKVTAVDANTYDLDFQIWNSDANGVLGTMKTEKVLNGVANSSIGSAPALHVYFSAAGSRMEKIDNFELSLEGNAAIVYENCPVVLTADLSAGTTTGATCGGTITSDGGSAVTARGVCWNVLGNPTIADSHTLDGTGSGVFESAVSGLAPGTMVYVRSYATNVVGTSYGSEKILWTAPVAAAPDTGDGTAGSPYHIANVNQLYWISQNPSVWGSQFIQTASMGAGGTAWLNGGKGWTPIGDASTPFSGVYNGQGQTVADLTVNDATRDYVGLFGNTSGTSRITALAALEVRFTGHNYVGGVIGMNAGTISQCYADGIVSGWQWCGGLIGLDNDAALDSVSFTNCEVSGYATCGGFVGGVYRTLGAPRIRDCFSCGNVTRRNGFPMTEFGGFAGYSDHGNIGYCYSRGSVHFEGASDPTANGFVGLEGGGSTYVSNFFDATTSGQSSGIGATAEPTSSMLLNTTYLAAGWNPFIWKMDSNINLGYPYIGFAVPFGTPLPIQLSSFTAAVTEGPTVLLRWTTATESNNYGFEVQRSADPKSGFTAISQLIPGNGTSLMEHAYTFADNSPSASHPYYRLKQVDRDGTVHIGEAITVAGITSTQSRKKLPDAFILSQNYPNPFNPSTTIGYALPRSAMVKLQVFDAVGREVSTLVHGIQEAGYHSVDVHGSVLASGVYFYRLEAGAFVATKRFVVLK